MSDLEDVILLDEIKALETVLTKKADTKPHFTAASTSATISDINSSNCLKDQASVQYVDEESDDLMSETISNYTDIEDIESTDDHQAALHLNKKLISYLLAVKSDLTMILEECRRKQALIEERLQKWIGSWSSSKIMICNAGMPYFKDKGLFPAPKNDDAKLKKANGELQIINLPCVSRWTPRDRVILVKAIINEAILTSYEKETESSRALPQLESKSELDKNFLSRDFRDMVGPLGAKKFDWLKIAATDFKDKHSAEECCVMWNVFLHPDINKQSWSKTEISKLKSLADSYNLENWDMIAEELGTRRTGYQCFIKYNMNNRNINLRGHSWNRQADEKLVDLVSKLRIGDFIPWGEVTRYMGDRTKQQIYFRWMYSLVPNLKKGRFTKEEDEVLLNAVAKYGTKFSKISAISIPSRSSVQLSDHYQLLTRKTGKSNRWSIQDDAKLLKLQAQLGQNWSEIAKHFSQKTRVQVRHRYSAILRYLKKGISLSSIPRAYNKNVSQTQTLTSGEPIDELDSFDYIQRKENYEDKKESDIDKQLLEYFKLLPPGKPGRKRKYYTLDELKTNTEKLYEILRILNANLAIPDNIQDVCFNFSDKDKQLLISLKEYFKMKSNKTQCRSKLIEDVRLKMFGPISSSESDNHFVPPLPIFCSQSKTKKVKQSNLIDAHLDKNQKFLAEVKMEFKTSSFVVSLIGGVNEQHQFQKLTKILLSQSKTLEKRNVRKVYILSPQTLLHSNRISQITLEHNNYVANCQETGGSLSTNHSLPSTSINVPNARTYKNTSKLIRQSNTILTDTEKLLTYCTNSKNYCTVIEPNYSTLLGFQNILATKRTFYTEDSTDDEYQEDQNIISWEGQRAIHLLEKRLLKLFKFPIIMSNISPPDVKKLDSIFSLDAENTSASHLKRKKKTYTKSTSKKVKTTKME